MKILIIDCRNIRGKLIQGLLTQHDVCHLCHVDGTSDGQVLDTWNSNCAAQVSEQLVKKKPDLILLHVGENQYQWGNALSECYKDHIVVCFTGAGIPPEVKEDCATSKKHCYCPFDFKSEYLSLASLSESIEWREIIAFIDGMKTDLDVAKRKLQRYDETLERVLEDLYLKLQEGINSGKLSVKEMVNYRDNRLKEVLE